MRIVLAYILGIVVGILTSQLIRILKRKPPKYSGALVVDRSDPEDGPYIFLELKDDPSILEQSETATFVIVSKNYISQK